MRVWPAALVLLYYDHEREFLPSERAHQILAQHSPAPGQLGGLFVGRGKTSLADRECQENRGFGVAGFPAQIAGSPGAAVFARPAAAAEGGDADQAAIVLD